MGLFAKLTAKAEEYDNEYESASWEEEDFEDYSEPATISEIRSAPAQELSRIVTRRVSSYSEISTFASTFKDGIPVILDLSAISEDEIRRVLDFSVGISYALDGGISKISETIFLLSPKSVKVVADSGEQANLLQ